MLVPGAALNCNCGTKTASCFQRRTTLCKERPTRFAPAKIVALKGIGGFQLIVDARNRAAVVRLRERKHREEKPFALMYPSLDAIRADCEISELEERSLLSPESPIVLVKRDSLGAAKRTARRPVSTNWLNLSRREIRISA